MSRPLFHPVRPCRVWLARLFQCWLVWLLLVPMLASARDHITERAWQEDPSNALTLEQVPDLPQTFDTILSMGVLYHRRDPLQHLMTLKRLLKPGGELLLETLVVEGGVDTVLVPEDRYCRMRNVWFLPSVAQLIRWCERLGFRAVRCVDLNWTSVQEQRRTDWMTFDSLAESLDPHQPRRTVEGLPAPLRAALLMQAP